MLKYIDGSGRTFEEDIVLTGTNPIYSSGFALSSQSSYFGFEFTLTSALSASCTVTLQSRASSEHSWVDLPTSFFSVTLSSAGSTYESAAVWEKPQTEYRLKFVPGADEGGKTCNYTVRR